MLNTMNKLSSFIIFISIIMSLSTSSWFQLWILLELNMMAFIPLMYNYNSLSINAMLKYFFIQAIASSLFLLSILMSSYLYNLNNDYLILLSMMTKLGMFPMFMWFPQVSKMISWLTNSYLMTVQKFIPLFMSMLVNTELMKIIIILSAFVSSMGMWNQNSIQSIMAYSSMNHMSWMLISIMMKMFLWIIYLLIYSLMMIILINIFIKNNINSYHQISNTLSNKNSLMMIINMWSLGGLPPLLGFIPKWMMIMNMKFEMLNLYIFIILSSFINIITYTRLLYPTIMKTNMVNVTPNNWSSLNIFFMIPMMIFIFM